MSPSQRVGFLSGEGDAFFARNDRGEKLAGPNGGDDPVLRLVKDRSLALGDTLEIGASDGWRLAAIRSTGATEQLVGLDPSRDALRAGSERFGLAGVRGTAEALPFAPASFDTVILGFFLYLCDREDLFRIAEEVDRVLRDPGQLVILDFEASSPYRKPYTHQPGLHSYKMDYSKMFEWNPAYQEIHRESIPHPGSAGACADDRITLTLLERRSAGAYREGAPPEALAPRDRRG